MCHNFLFFLISAGEKLEKINAAGQCEEGLYHGKGGTCKDKPCMDACQKKHGSQASGICFSSLHQTTLVVVVTHAS